MGEPLKAADRFRLRIGGVLFSLLLRALAWSCRLEIRNVERLESALASGRPVILGVWHGDIVPLLCFRNAVRLPPLITLVSRSKDGEMAAAFARAILEITCVRASSSRGGARGALEFLRQMNAAAAAAVPPMGLHFLDGPRGPRHRAKGGVLLLARTTNALVVPLVFGLSRRWRFRSWDRHRVPKPFARCVVTIGEAVDFSGAMMESSAAADPRTDGAEVRLPAEDAMLEGFERGMEALASEETLAARDYDGTGPS